MPTLTQLEYIEAVFKTRHFGRAAELCNVSQPSLSAQIQKAEDELNTTIFDRTKKPILVTDTGQRIIEQAKAVLREHRRLIQLPQEEGELQGEFHLGIIPTLAPYVLPLFLKSFAESYPKVELRISEIKTHEIISALHEDTIDGGLLVTPLNEPKVSEHYLFSEPFQVFASPTHTLCQSEQLCGKDLDSQGVWLLEEGHCFRNQVLHICTDGKGQRSIPNVYFESGNLETLKQLIRNGDGYTLLPFLAAEGLTPEEKKEQLKSFESPIPTREISIAYSRDFYKKSILTALAEHIVNSLPPALQKLQSAAKETVPL